MPTQRVPYPQFVAKFDAMIDLYAKQTNIQTMGEGNYPVCTPAPPYGDPQHRYKI